jgi:cysteine-rich repeat protein
LKVESDHKCDDGNTFNGDGCDSKCQVEENYVCS